MPAGEWPMRKEPKIPRERPSESTGDEHCDFLVGLSANNSAARASVCCSFVPNTSDANVANAPSRRREIGLRARSAIVMPGSHERRFH